MKHIDSRLVFRLAFCSIWRRSGSINTSTGLATRVFGFGNMNEVTLSELDRFGMPLSYVVTSAVSPVTIEVGPIFQCLCL